MKVIRKSFLHDFVSLVKGGILSESIWLNKGHFWIQLMIHLFWKQSLEMILTSSLFLILYSSHSRWVLRLVFTKNYYFHVPSNFITFISLFLCLSFLSIRSKSSFGGDCWGLLEGTRYSVLIPNYCITILVYINKNNRM